MASNENNTNDEAYNKEYRRLKTLTSQTDIVESSVGSSSYFIDLIYRFRFIYSDHCPRIRLSSLPNYIYEYHVCVNAMTSN